MKNRMAGGTTIYHCGGSRSLLATRQYLFIRDGVDPGEIGAWQHTHKMQQGTNNQLCCEKAAENFDKYAKEMNKKYGSNWQTTQPNIDTSVVAESTGGKPHGRYAMGDGLVSKPPKSKKRPRPRALPTEPCHSFYPSAQVVFQQVQSNSAWCAGVQRLLQELANKNALDINTFMHPLPPSIDIVALMQSQHPGEFSYLPVLNQIEANSEWRVGVERMLQVLAEKHFLDYDGLMHPQASEHQSSFSSGVGCSRNHNPHSACCSAAAT